MFLFPTGGKSWRSQVDVTESPTYFDSVFFFGCSQLLGRESPESGKVLEVPLFWSGEISLCADLQLNLTWKIPCGFAARLYLALADSPSHSCTVVEMPLPKMASSGAGFDGFFHAGMDLAKPFSSPFVG